MNCVLQPSNRALEQLHSYLLDIGREIAAWNAGEHRGARLGSTANCDHRQRGVRPGRVDRDGRAHPSKGIEPVVRIYDRGSGRFGGSADAGCAPGWGEGSRRGLRGNAVNTAAASHDALLADVDLADDSLRCRGVRTEPVQPVERISCVPAQWRRRSSGWAFSAPAWGPARAVQGSRVQPGIVRAVFLRTHELRHVGSVLRVKQRVARKDGHALPPSRLRL